MLKKIVDSGLVMSGLDPAVPDLFLYLQYSFAAG